MCFTLAGKNQPGPVFSTSRTANVEYRAVHGGLVNAPQLTNCNINGHVAFNIKMGNRKKGRGMLSCLMLMVIF